MEGLTEVLKEVHTWMTAEVWCVIWMLIAVLMATFYAMAKVKIKNRDKYISALEFQKERLYEEQHEHRIEIAALKDSLN